MRDSLAVKLPGNIINILNDLCKYAKTIIMSASLMSASLQGIIVRHHHKESVRRIHAKNYVCGISHIRVTNLCGISHIRVTNLCGISHIRVTNSRGNACDGFLRHIYIYAKQVYAANLYSVSLRRFRKAEPHMHIK